MLLLFTVSVGCGGVCVCCCLSLLLLVVGVVCCFDADRCCHVTLCVVVCCRMSLLSFVVGVEVRRSCWGWFVIVVVRRCVLCVVLVLLL